MRNKGQAMPMPVWSPRAGALPAQWQVKVLSGYGGKHPAAVLVQTPHWRVLLDAGASLETENKWEGDTAPTEAPAWLEPLQQALAGAALDAVLITHDHVDHIGAQDWLPPQVPRYVSDAVRSYLTQPALARRLPLCGRIMLEKPGVPPLLVRTGANGHSLGGVWLHLSDPNEPAASVWYSGDVSLESRVYRLDLPPQASVALIDASYGWHEAGLAHSHSQLAAHLTGPLVLPVPATGRALEVALWLHKLGRSMVLDSGCAGVLHQALALGDEHFVPGVWKQLQQLARTVRQGDRAVQQALAAVRCDQALHTPVLLVADPAPDGRVAPLLAQCLQDGQCTHTVVFTGYCPTTLLNALSDAQLARVHRTRWNVHPRRRDVQTLLSLLQPRDWCPMFTGEPADGLVPDLPLIARLPPSSLVDGGSASALEAIHAA